MNNSFYTSRVKKESRTLEGLDKLERMFYFGIEHYTPACDRGNTLGIIKFNFHVRIMFIYSGD